MTNAELFASTAARLQDNELIVAYKALLDADAPFACLDIILGRMIDAFGLDEAEKMVDQFD
ncbi:predicted protein [Cyanophage PSS2]|uniref:hypothetical protein n=1 Tax=Cyanophage PSS2 TaxID=658401 RepID=UPI0001B03FE7|nr:hypothetical protein PSS2_gp018 [Cyanophage PSS2]ACT65580.1 hypothetical protein [Cyanophage PSS2]ACY75722.1 predicted protein [Cyanophage PSS2]